MTEMSTSGLRWAHVTPPHDEVASDNVLSANLHLCHGVSAWLDCNFNSIQYLEPDGAFTASNITQGHLCSWGVRAVTLFPEGKLGLQSATRTQH